jgi:predicted secreted Zn-dependent protease
VIRSRLSRRTPLRKQSKKRGAQRYDYQQAKALVWARDGGRCRLQGSGTACDGPVDPHHVWPQSRYPERRCDPEAMVLLCRRHHEMAHLNPRWAKKEGWLK